MMKNKIQKIIKVSQDKKVLFYRKHCFNFHFFTKCFSPAKWNKWLKTAILKVKIKYFNKLLTKYFISLA